MAWGPWALSPMGAVLVSVAYRKEETYPSWARQWERTWICGGDSVGFGLGDWRWLLGTVRMAHMVSGGIVGVGVPAEIGCNGVR